MWLVRRAKGSDILSEVESRGRYLSLEKLGEGEASDREAELAITFNSSAWQKLDLY